MSRAMWLVQFVDLDANGKAMDAMGSDGCHQIDGRLSTHGMENAALQIAQRREHYRKYAGYYLVRRARRYGADLKKGPPHTLSYPIRCK